MLLNFDKIYEKYSLNVKGILHIGAHYGEEDILYRKKNITNIIYFEPLYNNYKILEERVSKDAIIHKLALGNQIGEIDMFVESDNQGMSSSILKPKHHLIQYPHIRFKETERVKINKLDNIEFNRNNFNFINIDVQGYELEVFKGGENTLNNIDYIITEVNRDYLYENCSLVEELDEFLGKFNFLRVETTWDGNTWGDAFYIKNK